MRFARAWSSICIPLSWALKGDHCVIIKSISDSHDGLRDRRVVLCRSIFQGMDDTTSREPDHNCLFAIAAEQRGFFTIRQAHDCGLGSDLITYHTRRGTYTRVSRGLYRLSNFPSSPREEVIAAWLAVPGQKAVVSHESALDIHGLSDVIPNQIHLTVPRSMRNVTPLPGVKIHTTTRPLLPSEVIFRDGVRVTSAARSIVDAAEEGTDPVQISMAIAQAMDQGLTTRRRLEHAVSTRSARVKALVTQSLESANP